MASSKLSAKQIKELKDEVRNTMIKELRSQLRMKQDEDEEEYYNAKFDGVEFEDYLNQNKDKLEEAVEYMYSTFEEDDELDDLKNVELDWYREFVAEIFTDLYS